MNTPTVEDLNAAPAAASAPPRVTLRALYEEAMREVLADPRKAVAEHDPRLAELLQPPAIVAKR